MSKLKETIKKALEKTYWVNSVGEFKNPSDYPQEFEQKFGNISLNTIVLDDYLIDARRLDDIHDLFKRWKFDVTHQYKINDFKSGYYFNEFLYLMVRCNFGLPENKINKEDDDDDIEFISMESGVVSISFCPLLKNKNAIEKLLEELIDMNVLFIPDSEKNFYMIAQNAQGLYKQKTTFNNIEIKDGRYDLYYGKKCPIDKFKQFMRDDNTESLLLLHGDPGAGKSNMLKNLILETDEDVIYVPPSMVSVISSPDFISFMIKNKKNFLIIEDAEEILSVDRNSGTNNLLSICDGFLKDALQMKIICTFNCDLNKIDPALLRKGRLFFEYKFGALSKEEVQDLSNFCNLGLKVDKEMTLAEIFNSEKDVSIENSFEERRIGFF
jgi:hypothetical protein